MYIGSRPRKTEGSNAIRIRDLSCQLDCSSHTSKIRIKCSYEAVIKFTTLFYVATMVFYFPADYFCFILDVPMGSISVIAGFK